MSTFMVYRHSWAWLPGSRVLTGMEHLHKWMRGDRRKTAFCTVMCLATLGKAWPVCRHDMFNSRLSYTSTQPGTSALKGRCCSKH